MLDRPIERTETIQRRVVLMPRGQKTSSIRETRISLARIPSLERPIEPEHTVLDAGREAEAAAMAALVTPADVAAHNTVLVLLRHGWTSKEFAPLIDRVEAIVTASVASSQPIDLRGL